MSTSYVYQPVITNLTQTFLSMQYLWSPWRMDYIQNHANDKLCAFCSELARPDSCENLIVYRGQKVFLILNRYPYTSGHIMIVPYEHVSTLGALDVETRNELIDITNRAINILQTVYQAQGFNVGMNIGEAAGAGITEHVHMHVVPRWSGDTNFMSSLGSTRVLPEALKDTYKRIKDAWKGVYQPPIDP